MSKVVSTWRNSVDCNGCPKSKERRGRRENKNSN